MDSQSDYTEEGFTGWLYKKDGLSVGYIRLGYKSGGSPVGYIERWFSNRLVILLGVFGFSGL